MARLTPSKLAKDLGINIETLRYYERIGLVASPERTAGGHRTYTDADVQRFRFVCRARTIGFSIPDVRMLLSLSDQPAACEEVQKIAQRQLDHVRHQLAQLRASETVLADALEHCDVTDRNLCPVLTLLESADAQMQPAADNANGASGSCCSGMQP